MFVDINQLARCSRYAEPLCIVIILPTNVFKVGAEYIQRQ